MPALLQHGPDVMANCRIYLTFWSAASHDREDNSRVVLELEERQLPAQDLKLKPNMRQTGDERVAMILPQGPSYRKPKCRWLR
jgi:hypothetical protein